VAVNVDALQIAALIEFRTVGIQHWNRTDSELRRKFLDPRHIFVGRKIREYVDEGRRCGRFIAMHLRPKKNLQRPAAKLHLIDLATGVTAADLTDLAALSTKFLDIDLQIRMPNVRRFFIRYVRGIPGVGKFLGSLG